MPSTFVICPRCERAWPNTEHWHFDVQRSMEVCPSCSERLYPLDYYDEYESDGYDEYHSDMCCCEECLQAFPERDILWNDGQYYGYLDEDKGADDAG